MYNVVPLLPGDKVTIQSGHLQGWGQPTLAMTHLYMMMLTNRNALIVKLNLITMPEQIIKVSECQPTTVWRIVVLFTKQRQQLLASECQPTTVWRIVVLFTKQRQQLLASREITGQSPAV